MINEQRVKLMTRLAAYEEGEGKKNATIGSYFRGDYISLQLMKSIVSATISFGLIAALFVMYDSEAFMQNLYQIDLVETGKQILYYYLGFVVFYMLVSYAVYAWRYHRAKKRLKVYYNNLRRLQVLYQRERKDKTQS